MKKNSFFETMRNLVFRSLSVQILFTLLFMTLIPLSIYGMYSIESVTKTLDKTAKETGNLLFPNVIKLYQTNISSQAQLIDLELMNVQSQVLSVRTQAEQIYRHPEQFPRLPKLTLENDHLGYYWEKVHGKEISNTGTNIRVSMTPNLLDKLRRSKYLESMFRHSLKMNTNIVSMYFILPENAWRIYPAINMKKEVDSYFLPPDIPITDYSFYRKATPQNNPSLQAIWTDPYMDITHRSWMFSSSAPVMSQTGELLGVIGADVTIDNLVSNILNTKFTHPRAYAFLVNQQNQLIALQEQGIESFKQLKFSQKIANQASVPSTLELNEDTILLTAFIPSTHWYLGYVIPKSDMVSPIYEKAANNIIENGSKLKGRLIIISSFLTVLCMLMTLIMWKKMTSPLKKLLKGLAAIKAGRYSTQVPDNKMMEFNEVSRAFNQMSLEIQHLIHSKEQRLKEKEALQAELIMLNHQLETKVAERTEELREAYVELLQRNEQLKQFEQSRSTFFSNISHDFKTPLTLISGYLEAIRDGVIPADQQAHYIARIQQRITSVNRLVRDLFELSILETKSQAFSFQTMPVTALLAGIRQKWEMPYMEGFHQLQFDFPDRMEEATISLDLDYIYRATDNLLDNAQKFSSKDKPIRIKAWCNGQFLFLSITDEGQGISEEHLPYLFDRSYRADKARNSKIPGHGLGLAIVKEILQAHQGMITVISQIEVGTTFTIQLPIQK